MSNLGAINPEKLESRLLTIRHQFMKAEMLGRAIQRIASDPDNPLEDLQYRLNEIEFIAESLVALIEEAAGDMEPVSLNRWAATAGEEASDE
jgi:hypothetical protein